MPDNGGPATPNPAAGDAAGAPDISAASPVINRQREDKQARQQMKWNDAMRFEYKFVHHEKVAVLLVSWHGSWDDLGTEQEVANLSTVFDKTYGFDVVPKQLHGEHGERSAQQQMRKHLVDFVWEHDGKDNLLIVYYAGHGWSSEVGFKMAGKKSMSALQKMKNEAQRAQKEIIWKVMEDIIEDTQADVLLIFDCCHAGAISRRTRGPPTQRCFQFLGACTADRTTKGPGPHSFTSALIWALTELAAERRFFHTPALYRKIMEYDQFPATQVPQLTHHGSVEPSPDAVCISKAMQNGGETELASSPSDGGSEARSTNLEFLDLRFFFKTELDDEELQRTAEALRDLTQQGAISTTNIAFLRTSSAQQDESQFSEALGSLKHLFSHLCHEHRIAPDLSGPTV